MFPPSMVSVALILMMFVSSTTGQTPPIAVWCYDEGILGKGCCCETEGCDTILYNNYCYQDLENAPDLTSPVCMNCVANALTAKTSSIASDGEPQTKVCHKTQHYTKECKAPVVSAPPVVEVTVDATQSAAHEQISPMPDYSGVPACLTMFGVAQPNYPVGWNPPLGGGPCACGAAAVGGGTVPGMVYGWSVVGGGSTKVGCSSGGDAECLTRIKQEMQGGTTFYYYCKAIPNVFTYARSLLNGGTQNLYGCNAAEVKIQDILYCSGTWLGGGAQGVGKPAQATASGYTEWFGTGIDTVITDITNNT